MSQIEVERFLGRLITDQDFRLRAIDSMDAAICSEGMVLTPAEISILHHIDFSRFSTVSESVDNAIKRS